MVRPTLIIMAAGIGSRYGGLKQIEPIGPSGELIIDYSIYDAVQAGFDKIVFVIKEEMKDTFREKIGSYAESIAKVSYVYQSISVPEAFAAPPERNKPWGTAHAVLCCKDAVTTPFAVINADDFYGSGSFQALYKGLTEAPSEEEFYQYCMAGFILENTLTDNGHVARGICRANSYGHLVDIVERTHIEKTPIGAKYTEDGTSYEPLDPKSIVSMNAWGFTLSLFTELEKRFPLFLEKNADNILKAEFFLPTVVDELIKENLAQVNVLNCHERWYGITYKEDRAHVQAAIAKMAAAGKYPVNLRQKL